MYLDEWTADLEIKFEGLPVLWSTTGTWERLMDAIKWSCTLHLSAKPWSCGKRCFFHLLMMATLNAYWLYKDHCTKCQKKPVLHRIFWREVVKALVGEISHQPIIVRGSVNPRDTEWLTGRHFLSTITQKEGHTSKPLRTCPVCSTITGKRKTAGDGKKLCISLMSLWCWTVCWSPFWILSHKNRLVKEIRDAK